MKKLTTVLTIILLLAGVALAIQGVYSYNRAATIVEPGQLHTGQYSWATLGTFTMTTATPSVTNRTAALFAVNDTNNVVYTIPSAYNRIRLRCSSTTDGDSSVFDVYLMNSASDHYNRVATLTFTTGTQTAGTLGYEFADTLVETNSNWHKTASVMSPTGNFIAEYAIDVLGSAKIGINPTTITNTAIVEISGY